MKHKNDEVNQNNKRSWQKGKEAGQKQSRHAWAQKEEQALLGALTELDSMEWKLAITLSNVGTLWNTGSNTSLRRNY